MTDFNWNSDDCKEDVVIKRVDALAVYGNVHGDLVLRQEDPLGENDAVIVIPISQIDTLIKAIKKTVESVKSRSK